MKQLWKRNAVVGTIVVFVCAAIFLNGKYAEKVEKPTKILGQSELVSTDGGAAEVSADAEGKDYFASARLTRQQARDSALSLLKEASESEEVDAETANEAAKSIETLASYTLCEAQIENIVTAKGYEDCVVFMSADGVSEAGFDVFPSCGSSRSSTPSNAVSRMYLYFLMPLSAFCTGAAFNPVRSIAASPPLCQAPA